MEKEILELLDGGRFFLVTPDNRLIEDKENRYNAWIFSYTGPSGLVYSSPRKKRWPSGKQDKRDLMNDRHNALQKEYTKPLKEIENFNLGYGYEFCFDREVIVLIENTKKWQEVLEKYGLTYSSIPKFEEKYKSLRLKKNYFRSVLDKRYFRLDLYDPYRHLNLEHDGSKFHISEIDKARDEYLKTLYPDLCIERILDYDERKLDKKLELKAIFDSRKNRVYQSPLVFRYSRWVIGQQLQEYESDLMYISECLKEGCRLENIKNDLALKILHYTRQNPLKPYICAPGEIKTPSEIYLPGSNK